MRNRTQSGWSARVALVVFVALGLLATACGPKSTNGVGGGGGGEGEEDRPQVKEEALKKFKQGVSIAESNPAQARSLFEDAVDEDDKFGEAWYNLGLIQDQAGETDAAVESYENAIETRPQLGDAYVNLGVIYLERAKAAEDEGERKELRDQAKQLFIKAVGDEGGVEPFHVEGNLNLGMVYRLEGEELVRTANQDADISATLDMGTVSERNYEVPEEAKLKFAEAVRHVRKALAGDANNITSYENLAAIYYDLNSLEVATLVSEQAIQKQIDRNEELKAQVDEGKITQQEYNQKMITDKQMAPVHNTYGLIWLARGEVALAYNSFKEAVARDPDFTEAKLNVAGVAVNVQDYETAYQIYTSILQSEPGNRVAKLSQAVAHRGLGRLDEAEKVYRSLLKEDPNFAPAMFNLGILYQEYHRDLETAKKIYEDFLALPTADESGRVADAEFRVQQIEKIWKQQAEMEAEQERIRKEMEELERLQKQQEQEMNEGTEGDGGEAPAEGETPAEGGEAPADGAPAEGGEAPADGAPAEGEPAAE